MYAATRGFHRDYEEAAPGRVCETFDEVVAPCGQDGDRDPVDLGVVLEVLEGVHYQGRPVDLEELLGQVV